MSEQALSAAERGPECPSCGVPFDEHDGFATMCRKLHSQPSNLNHVMPYMHSNGFSTERNATVEIMRALKLDETDFRLRDKLIMAGAPWIQAEREQRADEIEAVRNEVASVLMLMDGLAEVWGDEGVFRTCRDRLRKLVGPIPNDEGE